MSKFDFLKKLGIFSAVALTLAGCNNYNPEENIPEAIYGPPEMIEEAEEDTAVTPTVKPTKAPKPTEVVEEEVIGEFDPDMNTEVCIYGPPEMFGMETDDE